MPDEKAGTADEGRGTPAGSDQKTTVGRSREGRLLPGGSIEAAKRPIGINAIDRDQFPSYGLRSEQLRIADTPEEPEPRPAPPR